MLLIKVARLPAEYTFANLDLSHRSSWPVVETLALALLLLSYAPNGVLREESINGNELCASR